MSSHVMWSRLEYLTPTTGNCFAPGKEGLNRICSSKSLRPSLGKPVQCISPYSIISFGGALCIVSLSPRSAPASGVSLEWPKKSLDKALSTMVWLSG